jgi:4-diphosphocytidyl-2-C-methyl-D-erythritol kinase
LQSLNLLSPAKINLRLEILSKRPDNYHEIKTIFHKISIFDKIALQKIPGNEVQLTVDNPSIPTDNTNLAVKAANLIFSYADIKPGIKIAIKKKIPAGAGLGGGSSNAAITLKGLNTLLNLNISEQIIAEFAVKLGADVPFFLTDASTAYATGIGEKIKSIETHNKLWFLVIFPGFTVSTAWAYNSINKYNLLTKRTKNNNITNYSLDINTVKSSLYNDFESVVNKRHTEIPKIKEQLIKTGAQGAMLSGSGSSVFGIFPDKTSAENASLNFKTDSKQKVFIAQSL